MIEFKKMTLDDIGRIKPYFEYSETKTCDNTIGGSFMWRDFFSAEYAIVNETFLCKVKYLDNRTAFSMPLGKDVKGAIELIINYCHEKNIPVLFCTAAKEDVDVLGSLYDVTAKIEDGWSDYLYNASDLAYMKGRKYNGQRNHMNRFIRENPEYEYREINSTNLGGVRAFFDYYNSKTEKSSVLFFEEEKKVFEVIDNYDKYCQSGIALYSAGKIVAFTMGEAIKDTLYVHIEKADISVAGSYQMTVSGFVKRFIDKGVLYVNREDDSGDEGLRESKLSYHPCRLIDKYTVEINK